MINKRYDLVKVIYNDLYIYGKLQLFLLLLVFISAILVVIVTYSTRSVVMRHEVLLLEKRAINAEWNNLIFEERMLSNHNRIENIAKTMLHMRYVVIQKDNILMD